MHVEGRLDATIQQQESKYFSIKRKAIDMITDLLMQDKQENNEYNTRLGQSMHLPPGLRRLGKRASMFWM